MIKREKNRLAFNQRKNQHKFAICCKISLRACSSAVERYSYKVDVLGSNPSKRTNNEFAIDIEDKSE